MIKLKFNSSIHELIVFIAGAAFSINCPTEFQLLCLCSMSRHCYIQTCLSWTHDQTHTLLHMNAQVCVGCCSWHFNLVHHTIIRISLSKNKCVSKVQIFTLESFRSVFVCLCWTVESFVTSFNDITSSTSFCFVHVEWLKLKLDMLVLRQAFFQWSSNC